MSTVKTRFAPSPTGRMHVGNLRTALYAYLLSLIHISGRYQTDHSLKADKIAGYDTIKSLIK